MNFRHLISAALLLAALGSQAKAAPHTNPASIATHMNDEIKTLIQSYETALNTSNADGVMKLYASDPVFMPQHSAALVGRDAVKQGYDHVFSSIKLDVKFTVHEIEVLGDIAYGRTTSAGKTRILANGATVNEGNNELFVFKRELGQWKIFRYLFATSNPR